MNRDVFKAGTVRYSDIKLLKTLLWCKDVRYGLRLNRMSNTIKRKTLKKVYGPVTEQSVSECNYEVRKRLTILEIRLN
jgi:hypothetical protein